MKAKYTPQGNGLQKAHGSKAPVLKVAFSYKEEMMGFPEGIRFFFDWHG